LRPAANVCRALGAVAVLTAPGAGPAELALTLHGWERTLVIAEDLGGQHERVSVVSLAEAAAGTWREPNVVLCLHDLRAVPRLGWIFGSEYPSPTVSHDQEVMASICAYVAPRPGQLVWVTGARAAAVTAGCVSRGAAVLVAEPDPLRCAVIPGELGAAAVGVRVVQGTLTAALPQPDAIYLGDGEPALVAVCAGTTARRLVVRLHDADLLTQTSKLLQTLGFTVDERQIAVTAGGERSTRPPAVALLLIATR
nr:precorrin-6y C5,15-methyltransferase (decarboxylating) subunit CbiE [Actinomycetota bacterium]